MIVLKRVNINYIPIYANLLITSCTYYNWPSKINMNSLIYNIMRYQTKSSRIYIIYNKFSSQTQNKYYIYIFFQRKNFKFSMKNKSM